MAFNRELAAEILRSDDRDRARFFAGRQQEIQSFDDALFGACQKKQAIFRIFQGAPGCGKTSLAAHLARIHKARSLFADISDTDDFDRASLATSIQNEALRRKAGSVAVSVANVAAAFLRNKTLTDEIGQQAAKVLSSKACFVIHIDEAHSIPGRFDPMLKSLHTKGCGVPCVVLLTGLGRTEERILSINGLSRTSIESAIELGALSEEECAESARMLLDKLDLDPAGGGSKEKMARLLSSFSSGWPQHLALAQKAFCEDIIKAEGVLGHADIGWIKQRAAALRAMYYEKRLNQPVFNRNKYVTREIVAEIHSSGILDIPQQLENLCARVIRHAGPRSETGMDEANAPAIADALIDKGVVQARQGLWKLAIPSMGNWAAQGLRQAKARPSSREALERPGAPEEDGAPDSAP